MPKGSSWRTGKTETQLYGTERAQEISLKKSQTHLGMKSSEETRHKQSEALKARWARIKADGSVVSFLAKISAAQAGRIYPDRRMKEDDRSSAKGFEWSDAVKKRDDYACQKCGKSFADGGKQTKDNCLHAHHIKPWDLYPELRFETSNGKTYCNRCHRTLEMHVRRSNALILKGLEEILTKSFPDLQSITSALQELLKGRIE